MKEKDKRQKTDGKIDFILSKLKKLQLSNGPPCCEGIFTIEEFPGRSTP